MDSQAEDQQSRDVDTRRRILDAAVACFMQFGNEKTTLNDVARVAALARQTIYRYFPDRAALLEAVRDLEEQRLRSEIEVVARRSVSFEEFLAGLVESHSATVSRYRTRQHLLERDRGLVQSLFLSREGRSGFIREVVTPELEVALRRGELAPDMDITAAAEWIAIVLSTVSTLTASTTFDLDDPAAVGRFYARHICRGLLVAAPGGPRRVSSTHVRVH